ITKNCGSALRQCRLPHDRILWVDAICINQTNLEEQEQQVALMQDICKLAARVLVYL
ncbi:hypothetical protein BS50DRAFT_452007, partial [Corynespora cassiicola Philippines]